MTAGNGDDRSSSSGEEEHNNSVVLATPSPSASSSSSSTAPAAPARMRHPPSTFVFGAQQPQQQEVVLGEQQQFVFGAHRRQQRPQFRGFNQRGNRSVNFVRVTRDFDSWVRDRRRAQAFSFTATASEQQAPAAFRNHRRRVVRAIPPPTTATAQGDGSATTHQEHLLGALTGARDDKEDDNNLLCSDDDDDDDNAVEEEEEDPDAPCCAICWEPASTKHNRRLVLLPCCDTAGMEQTSSTRFCEDCFIKYLQEQSLVIGSHSSWQGQWIAECPRCKHLLVQAKPTIAVASTAQQTKPDLQLASTLQMIWYAQKRTRGACRFLFVVMAGCHSDYIPIQTFKSLSTEMAIDLMQWGLLQRRHKNGSDKDRDTVYYMSPAEHSMLLVWCSQYLKMETRGGRIIARLVAADTSSDIIRFDNATLSLCTAVDLFRGSIWAIRDLKMVCAVRLVNRAMILVLVAFRLLPPLTEWRRQQPLERNENDDDKNHVPRRWTGWLATGLVLLLDYLWIKILIQVVWAVWLVVKGLSVFLFGNLLIELSEPVIWIAVYAATAFVACLMVGAIVKSSAPPSRRRRQDRNDNVPQIRRQNHNDNDDDDELTVHVNRLQAFCMVMLVSFIIMQTGVVEWGLTLLV